jgi:hypothetical protein
MGAEEDDLARMGGLYEAATASRNFSGVTAQDGCAAVVVIEAILTETGHE